MVQLSFWFFFRQHLSQIFSMKAISEDWDDCSLFVHRRVIILSEDLLSSDILMIKVDASLENTDR